MRFSVLTVVLLSVALQFAESAKASIRSAESNAPQLRAAVGGLSITSLADRSKSDVHPLVPSKITLSDLVRPHGRNADILLARGAKVQYKSQRLPQALHSSSSKHGSKRSPEDDDDGGDDDDDRGRT